MIPDYQVATIAEIDWSALRGAGTNTKSSGHPCPYEAVVFDKDNTLTVPYATRIHESCQASIQACYAEFEGRVAVLSNSAGMASDDPDSRDAIAFEDANQDLFPDNHILPVIRHKNKKPSRKCWEQTLAHFNDSAQLKPGGTVDNKEQPVTAAPISIQASQIIMVGDRLWTDIVFGNLYGCTTIYCAQTLDDTTDNWTAKQIRPIEQRMSRWWQRLLDKHPQSVVPPSSS
jgi:phosphatidylglycerophosphatase GEP4